MSNSLNSRVNCQACSLPKIEERRRYPTDDIFGMLVQAHDEQGQAMSDEQLIAHVNILLVQVMKPQPA